MTSLISGPTIPREKNEDYIILVLECIGHVESSIILMMMSKIMAKLRFGIGIMPYQGNLKQLSFFFFSNLVSFVWLAL